MSSCFNKFKKGIEVILSALTNDVFE
ncbi:Protein of unknown function [Gryllus bimaculatus]|nr:Protein of unknown function [Gryllus bimaculatus]